MAAADSSSNSSSSTLAPSQRYLLVVEYVGTDLRGWQRQSNTSQTVQQILEEAAEKLAGQPVTVHGSSRTDTGVHAMGNTCHLDIQRRYKKAKAEGSLQPHEPHSLIRALNYRIKTVTSDIMIRSARKTSDGFHSRYAAADRTYHYRIACRPPTTAVENGVVLHDMSVFERDRAWYVYKPLDLEEMRMAAQQMVGTHDFSSFRGVGCTARHPIRTLTELSIHEVGRGPVFDVAGAERYKEVDSEIDGQHKRKRAREEEGVDSGGGDGGSGQEQKRSTRQYGDLVIRAKSASFLYHQVRFMVGFLVMVGHGEYTADKVEAVMNLRSSEKIRMAPAHGLYLMEVGYPEEAYERTVEEYERIRRERIRKACGHDVFDDENDDDS